MIQNNVNKAIETLEEDDVQVDRIIEYMERNNSDAKNKVSVHAGCNVDLFMKLREEQKLEGLEADNRHYDNSDFWPKTKCETGSAGTPTMDGNSEERNADEKRNDSFNTEPIQMDAFFARHPIDTRCLGKHKVLLNQMENSTSMKDRFLIDVLKDVISYPQDDGKDEGTVTESTGTGDNDEQSTDEYSDVNGNEKSDEKSLSESDVTINTNAAGQHDKSIDDKSGKKRDESMNENENAAGKCDEKTETVSKDDVTMAKDTPVQEGEGVINIIPNGDGTGELTDVVDMSGKYLLTPDGTTCNIVNFDIS